MFTSRSCAEDFFLPHVSESKTVLDFGFHDVDSGFQVQDCSHCRWNLDLDSNRKRVSGISDSLTCISDPKAQDSGFHMYNFPGFQIPHAKIHRIRSFLQGENL